MNQKKLDKWIGIQRPVKKRRKRNALLAREKELLKQFWKRYKAGMTKWEDIPIKYRELLKKYYPVVLNEP